MKNAIYVMLVILVIVLGVVIVKSIIIDDNEALTSMKESENILENNLDIMVDNNVEDNATINNEENEIKEENIIKEETINDSMTDEEKAKAIVRKDWGEDSTIYLNVERKIEEGKYEIGIRECSTTKILYRYTVDINTGEFTYELEAH